MKNTSDDTLWKQNVHRTESVSHRFVFVWHGQFNRRVTVPSFAKKTNKQNQTKQNRTRFSLAFTTTIAFSSGWTRPHIFFSLYSGCEVSIFDDVD